jgi:hypothetical protein
MQWIDTIDGRPGTFIEIHSYLFKIFPLSWSFRHIDWVTSGFRRDVDQICALLGYYATSNGNPLPTFLGNVSLPSSRVKMGPIRCPKTSIKDYHYTLRNAQEER